MTKVAQGALEQRVQAAFRDRALLKKKPYADAVRSAIELLDRGKLRVAEPTGETLPSGQPEWRVHGWAREAILLYFAISPMKVMRAGPTEYHDRVPLKKGLAKAGIRVVPPATVRYGAFLESGAVVMPGYVNIGAYVGSGTMVDTWATVGSCAQVGRDCHLSGGVGLGGVLEPLMARPVIVEDGAFIGSRAIVVEGVHVGREAVIGAGVVLTGSTAIVDVTSSAPKEYRGWVPARSVVIPGTRAKTFAAGEYQVPCALIIGQRSESTDRKVSLNQALREWNVAV